MLLFANLSSDGDKYMGRDATVGYVCFLLAFMLLVSTLNLAQSNCPQGFVYVGTLSGTGSTSQTFDKRVTLRFPPNATLDESFQQQHVRATNGKSGAESSMRAEDIPKGVLVITYGKNDDIYNQGWAVSDPALKLLVLNATRKITRYEFGMKLFCNVGITGANPNFGECTVHAEVCYKPGPNSSN
jgi:hypothetical protein